MVRLLSVLSLLGCLAAGATECRAADAKSPNAPIGLKVEEFKLKDYRGKTHSLSDFKKSKLIVVAFMGTECPLAKLYAPRLAELASGYDLKDVAFIGINSNRQDSVTEIAAYARIHKMKFPVLKDVGNHVADQMKAVRTPEVYLLDQNRIVRYWGRIDDQYGIGYAREKPTRNFIKQAIDQTLAGKKIAEPVQVSIGCHIGRIRKPKSDSKITYSNQIARLLQKNCVECHRSGEIAPFALDEYNEVAGWAEMIAEVVREERMPPWHADAKVGHFANTRRMSKADKETIFKWVDAGAPEGNRADLPKSLHYTEGWQLSRKPDYVINMRDEPYTIPAEGAVKYQYFSVDSGFKEGKWVKAAELLPGNRAVVHHILVFVQPPGKGRRRGQGFMAAYVPGLRARPLPRGMAKYVSAGSKFIFQMHYTPNGSEQTDMSKMGLLFADPSEITHAVKTVEAINTGFHIPAYAGNHRVEATSSSYGSELMLLSFMPHMHLRGKSFSYEARYPNGKRETLLNVPRYDFNWQTVYRLTKNKALPKGTKIHCVAHFDNSEDNLNNPDPSSNVGWGDQTWNEMMIGFFDIAIAVSPEQVKNGSLPGMGPTPRSLARRLLKRFDKNKDGKVAKKEVPFRARIMFLRFDKNQDGFLTIEELTEVIADRQKDR